jgi:hypothetical protein
MAGQEHWPSVGSWISQADRARWQRRAAGELLKILAEWADLPAIAWTITPGGHLTGRVGAHAEPDGGRAAFTAWRVALRMDEVQETASGDGRRTYLRASASHEGIRVTIAATIAGLIDSPAPPSLPGRSNDPPQLTK